MNIQTLLIPNGYKIEEQSEIIEITAAGRILSGRKQRRYSCAIRHDRQANLIRHIWVCPFCNAHIPAYPEYFGRESAFEKIERPVIAEWADLQMSLFENQNNKLHLNNPIHNGRCTCPKCGKSSERSIKTKKITFEKKKTSLEITTDICEVSQLLSLHWVNNSQLSFESPVFETIVFNFHNGHTFLKLHDGDWTNYAISDITQKPGSWESGPLYEMFSTHKFAARTLKRYFSNVFGRCLPFSNAELSLDKYIMMCRFVGYPRCFYDAIPFVDATRRIDSSFKRIAQILHDSKNIPTIYKNSLLPNAKTIKKAFFKDPGLFFYIKECQQLWNALKKDVNLFRELITCNSIYDLLAQLHMYPGIIAFYRDYAKLKGAKSLFARLNRDLYEINVEAIMYASLNDSAKKQEQLFWENNTSSRVTEDEDERYYPLLEPVKYSVPYTQTDPHINPCIINGYSFTWLSNSSDFCEAGHALNNCLCAWSWIDNPVIVVRRDGVMVAAIEVDVHRHLIVQARAANNKLINSESELGKAYENWKKKNAFTESPLLPEANWLF